MKEQQTVYTTAELKDLGAVKQPRTFGITNPLDIWKLGNHDLFFDVLWSDKLKIHSAYAEVFEKAKLETTTKDLTANLQQPKAGVAKPAEKIVLDDLSLEEVA